MAGTEIIRFSRFVLLGDPRLLRVWLAHQKAGIEIIAVIPVRSRCHVAKIGHDKDVDARDSAGMTLDGP